MEITSFSINVTNMEPADKEGTIRPETNSNDFGFFVELISRFEFDFRRCGMFFNKTIRFFGVFKVQSHTHHVAVHVHLLWPARAHRIPIRMLLCP